MIFLFLFCPLLFRSLLLFLSIYLSLSLSICLCLFSLSLSSFISILLAVEFYITFGWTFIFLDTSSLLFLVVSPYNHVRDTHVVRSLSCQFDDLFRRMWNQFEFLVSSNSSIHTYDTLLLLYTTSSIPRLTSILYFLLNLSRDWERSAFSCLPAFR